MAHRIGDRILETITATIGTGNFTIAATTSGYKSLDSVCTSNADTIDVVLAKGTQWEYVRATRVSAGVYSRAATPYASSTGSQINFTAGATEVWCDVGAFFAEHLNTVEIAVASATTCDIGAVKGAHIEISGTTTITSLGTTANKRRYVRFSGALTLTHNATTLILPSAANIVTASGDTAIFVSDASGNWRCQSFLRANGTPVGGASFKVGSFTRDISTATGTQAVTGVGFRPKAVIFFANVNATSKTGIGLDDGAGHVGIWDADSFSDDNWAVQTSISITVAQSAGDLYQGSVSTLDTDGFTFSWTKTGSPTGTLIVGYMALR